LTSHVRFKASDIIPNTKFPAIKAIVKLMVKSKLLDMIESTIYADKNIFI